MVVPGGPRGDTVQPLLYSPIECRHDFSSLSIHCGLWRGRRESVFDCGIVVVAPMVSDRVCSSARGHITPPPLRDK